MKSKQELGKLINPVFVCLFEEKKKGEKNMARFKMYNSIYIHNIWRYEIYFMRFHIRFVKVYNDYDYVFFFAFGNLFKHIRLINKFLFSRWFIK